MAPPGRRRLRRRTVTDTALCPSRFRLRQKVIPLPTGQSLYRDLCHHRENSVLQRDAALNHIFMLGDAPTADEVFIKRAKGEKYWHNSSGKRDYPACASLHLYSDGRKV